MSHPPLNIDPIIGGCFSWFREDFPTKMSGIASGGVPCGHQGTWFHHSGGDGAGAGARAGKILLKWGPKWMVYKFIMENPIKMDDLERKPHFRKPPNHMVLRNVNRVL